MGTGGRLIIQVEMCSMSLSSQCKLTSFHFETVHDAIDGKESTKITNTEAYLHIYITYFVKNNSYV
jgi:hypothetical protein